MLHNALPACSTDDGGIQHTATCEGRFVLCLGQVESSQLSSFKRNLESVMAAVAERKGDARSAAVGRQGHQKTPAMVAAAVRQALAQTRSDAVAAAGGQQAAKVQECVPQGGFTDVGLHTGGVPRDTAWPLVREAVQVGGQLPGNDLWRELGSQCSCSCSKSELLGPSLNSQVDAVNHQLSPSLLF